METDILTKMLTYNNDFSFALQSCFLTTGRKYGCVNLCPTKSKNSWNSLDRHLLLSKTLIKIQPLSERLQKTLEFIRRVRPNVTVPDVEAATNYLKLNGVETFNELEELPDNKHWIQDPAGTVSNLQKRETK